MGHLGYLPKGRKVRDEAGLDTSPVAAQDGTSHQPGRDALRARCPEPEHGTRQRQKRPRAGAERGLDALPGGRHPEEAARSQRLSAFLGAATVALVAGVLGLSSALEIRAVERSKGTLSRLFG